VRKSLKDIGYAALSRLDALWIARDDDRCCRHRFILLRRLVNEKKLEITEAVAATSAKSAFLSTMSHEIRTPMNAVLGMADLLHETELSQEQRRYLDVMITNGNSLLDLINGILDLARIESGRMQLENIEFDLANLIDETISTFGSQAHGKGLEFTARIAPGVSDHLIGDPLRIRQILIDLIENAIKFTEVGKVTLDIDRDSESNQPDDLRFTVSDNGIGIPREKLSSIFSSFTQVDSSTTREYGGTGLGLAIAERLVKLMNGRIWVESAPGVGSKFTFITSLARAAHVILPIPNAALNLTGYRVPVVDDNSVIAEANRSVPTALPEAKPTVPADPQSANGASPARILVAEDSSDNRLVLAAYLRLEPYQIEFAKDGQEAVRKFTAKAYDLVFMDVQMPKLDGLEATRLMRQWEKDHCRLPIPIIALSASILSEDVHKAVEAGCDIHVGKPVKKAVLLQVIREWLARKGDASPSPQESESPALEHAA